MQPDRILRWSKTLNNQTITANTAGTDITLPIRKVIGISVDGKAFITFNNTGVNAAATDTLLPAAGVYVFDTGTWTVLSIFAHSGANVIASVFEAAN